MYDNATKQSARCWCWNQVCQRVPKGSTVMVLIGETNYEFTEAMKRGMKVVGIDLREQSVKQFREAGGIAIQDDFREQMVAIKPDAVIFDGVSGLTGYTEHLSEWAALCNVKAFVWNGLRGRDRHSAEWKKRFSNYTIEVYSKGRFTAKREPGIHRAMLLYAKSHLRDMRQLEKGVYHILDMLQPRAIPEMLWIATKLKMNEMGLHWEAFQRTTVEILRASRDKQNVLLDRREFALVTAFEDIFNAAVSLAHKPEFMTYRSKDSGQYFDTGAWSPLPTFDISMDVKRSSKLKASAAKALLTMRS